MTYRSDRAAVSERFRQIQESCGEADDNVAFSDRLNAAAKELGFEQKWTANRVSKVRGATLGTDIEDAYVVARVDPKQRGPTFVTHGIPVTKGEDAWAVLARMAKKPKTA